MIKIDNNFIDLSSQKAKTAKRRRMNYNFHSKPQDTMQRMLNAMEPDTYIQPHKHENPDKTEAFFCLRGRLLVVEFSDQGKVLDFVILDPLAGSFGCEIPARTWHAIISLEAGSVAYEVKDGPYNPEDDKHFADWAPSENDPNANDFNKKLIKALEENFRIHISSAIQ
ncbi:MAG: WbuC family cupin fold metalloprotein [Bacteroidetes bacterium]|nr:WbuC family cupin fold metalloprotein [Bacteroidota bacterium]MBU1578836.1 WbuC family cupin fold metalloprotein [Bacteroidota bacterium]MBU2558460.1 WbuC family cupin fold metalloprotein [Bacteroidota bacterium]